MTTENEFYTLVFLKAFARSEDDYADRESALMWKIASENSVIEANQCYVWLNEAAAALDAEIKQAVSCKPEY